MKKDNKLKRISNASDPKLNKNVINKPKDPMLNSLFKGQKFIDFQEPIQNISHIKETNIPDFSAESYYQTGNFKLEQIEIKEEEPVESNFDLKQSIINEYLKRGNYSCDTDHLQTNYTSPLKENEKVSKILTTEMIQSEEFLNFINETENSNLEFLKTLYRLKSSEREITHRKRESYSFVNTIKDEARYNLENRYSKENNEEKENNGANTARKVEGNFKTYKKEATTYTYKNNNFTDKLNKDSDNNKTQNDKTSNFTRNVINVSSKSILPSNINDLNKLAKSTNINKNKSAINIRETSYTNIKKKTVKIATKKNLMSLKDLQMDLSKLSQNTFYKNEEIVNYSSKPIENQQTKDIPTVEIDLFGNHDIKEEDLSGTTMQLYPIYESGNFEIKNNETLINPQLDFSVDKFTYTSNARTELISIDNSVLNQYSSEMNKKQNQTTYMPTQYGSNNTERENTLNLSKFTNFSGFSQQYKK